MVVSSAQTLCSLFRHSTTTEASLASVTRKDHAAILATCLVDSVLVLKISLVELVHAVRLVTTVSLIVKVRYFYITLARVMIKRLFGEKH